MAWEPPDDGRMDDGRVVDTYARPRTMLINGTESVSIIGSRQLSRLMAQRACKALAE